MASGIQVKEALLFELLNELESDSAESEDEELLAAIRHKRIPTPKILDYVDNVVHRYSDEEVSYKVACFSYFCFYHACSEVV